MRANQVYRMYEAKRYHEAVEKERNLREDYGSSRTVRMFKGIDVFYDINKTQVSFCIGIKDISVECNKVFIYLSNGGTLLAEYAEGARVDYNINGESLKNNIVLTSFVNVSKDRRELRINHYTWFDSNSKLKMYYKPAEDDSFKEIPLER